VPTLEDSAELTEVIDTWCGSSAIDCLVFFVTMSDALWAFAGFREVIALAWGH
jgi:hypothetical protein